MNRNLKVKPLELAVCMALPMLALPALAAEPYPAVPPTISNSVPPNVLLHIDNSGSMKNVPPAYIDKNGNTVTPTEKKIDTAKAVAKELVTDKANANLRWGIFSFDKTKPEEGGVLRAAIASTSTTQTKALTDTIDGFAAETYTPLGEAMMEITRYFSGSSSYFGKQATAYTSPIEYRCQKNFAIIVTDGVSTRDSVLPGVGRGAETYTSYDADGNAVTKTFNVCQSKSTTSSIPCQEILEGSTTASAYVGNAEDAATYRRSIRDVAAYAYDMDMRVGGLDKDGKSFDQAPQPKQNLTTFTVGFAIDDPVLQATAIVGRGKYYVANDRAALKTALSNAVSEITSTVSNAGGVATQNEYVPAGNVVLQPLFNPAGWYGELLCFNVATDGSFNTACANPKATFPAADSRNIYTNSIVGTGSTAVGAKPAISIFNFDESAGFDAMTAAQKLALSTVNAAAQKNVINFIRGVEGIAGFRTRSKGLLGDIIDGRPTVVSAPGGVTSDAAYSTFQATNANRKIAFIGANDGMLHAFDMSNMSELMGYVPSVLYPKLSNLTAVDYGKSGGTLHTFYVNGNSRQADIRVGGTWKTILVGGLGQGGQGYYGVDATSTSTLSSATSAIKWEWNDSADKDMGYSFGTPVIYNVRTASNAVVPAVVLANGYENDYDDTAGGGQKTTAKSSALYIINADTGALLSKIVVPGSAGLSSPAGVDYGQDGILDYVYAGDLNGKLWRFDLTGDSPSTFKLVTTPIFDAGIDAASGSALGLHPIVMRPAVMPVGSGAAGNVVIFGTGALLKDADRNDTTVQSLYGVLDDMSDSPTTVTRAGLQAQTVVDTATVTSTGLRNGTYRKMSTNPLDLASATNTKKGWYVDLPVSTERLVTPPVLHSDKVLFGTGITVTDEACLIGGQGWVMGLNPLTGSLTYHLGRPYTFIDINGDKRSSDPDKIGFTSGSAFMSGYSTAGIPTDLTYIANAGTVITPASIVGGTLGNIGNSIALKGANTDGVFVGYALPKVTTGTAIGRPEGTGGGLVVVCVKGSDKCDKDWAVGFGAKVETSIWREIK